jgi:hypothetical protein
LGRRAPIELGLVGDVAATITAYSQPGSSEALTDWLQAAGYGVRTAPDSPQ